MTMEDEVIISINTLRLRQSLHITIQSSHKKVVQANWRPCPIRHGQSHFTDHAKQLLVSLLLKWLVDNPPRGPAINKLCSCYDVIMVVLKIGSDTLIGTHSKICFTTLDGQIVGLKITVESETPDELKIHSAQNFTPIDASNVIVFMIK